MLLISLFSEKQKYKVFYKYLKIDLREKKNTINFQIFFFVNTI